MNPELIENIEKYIRREISYDSLEDYAREQNVEDLQEKIQWVRSISVAFELDDVRAQVKDITEKESSDPKPVISIKRHRWSIGIAASVFLVAAFLWLNRSAEGLYGPYEFNDPGISIRMSETGNYSLYDALTYFSEEDYKTAIEKMLSIDDQSSDTLRYYLGASYYYTEQWDKADPYLKDIAKDTSSVFSQRAEWMMVLMAAKQNRKEDALRLVDGIVKDKDHLFYTQAIKLQVELREE